MTFFKIFVAFWAAIFFGIAFSVALFFVASLAKFAITKAAYDAAHFQQIGRG